MRMILFAAVILLVPFSSYALLEINEVMYAPSDDNEWIELWNDGNTSVDMTGWTLMDLFSVDDRADELTCCPSAGNPIGNSTSNSTGNPAGNCSLIIKPSGYALITDQDSTLYSSLETDALKVCVDDNSIGNGLGNTHDQITIGNGSYTVMFSYDSGMGGKGNNRTLERRDEGTWGESILDLGTPGSLNSIALFSSDFLPLVISEVFPDPFGQDTALKPQGEWIEVYNPGPHPIMLDNLSFTDSKGGRLYVVSSKILAKNGLALFPDSYVIIYRDGDADFSLNNNGVEVISLWKNDLLIDTFPYSGSTSGMSWSNLEGDVYLTPPTPGEINFISEECDWLLLLNINESIYQSADFSFDLTISRFLGLSQNVSVEGKIEDNFGQLIREYRPWTDKFIDSDQTKTYSPNLPEGMYQISFWISSLECQEADPTDNIISRLVAINPQYKQFDSHVAIETISLGSDEKARWGDQFLARVSIYKGNTTRTAIEMWVEKESQTVSKRSKLNIYEQFQPYTLTLPVQLHPNCANEDADDGTATLILEGLGERIEKPFLVSGINEDICKDYNSFFRESDSSLGKFSMEANYPSALRSGEPFPVNVQFIGDSVIHDVEVWAYLYRGSRCYSCSDGFVASDFNRQTFRLRSNEAKIINFFLTPDDSLEGEYKLKVKVRKDGQKTLKEITKKVYVSAGKGEESTAEQDLPLLAGSSKDSLADSPMTAEKRRIHGQTGMVVYESNSVKANKLLPYFLLLSLSLIVIITVWRK